MCKKAKRPVICFGGGAPYRDNVFEREAYAASPISSMPGACAGMGKVK